MLASAFILMGSVVLVSAVQVIVKSRLTTLFEDGSGTEASIVGVAWRLLQDPTLWFAGSLILVAAFLWYFGLSRVPLSVAISFAALTYPMVMAASHFFLKEPISAVQVMGCALLVVGVLMIAGRGWAQ